MKDELRTWWMKKHGGGKEGGHHYCTCQPYFYFRFLVGPVLLTRNGTDAMYYLLKATFAVVSLSGPTIIQVQCCLISQPFHRCGQGSRRKVFV